MGGAGGAGRAQSGAGNEIAMKVQIADAPYRFEGAELTRPGRDAAAVRVLAVLRRVR